MNVPAKPLRIIIFSLFLILLLGSLYFALERIMFCDASLIFTEILNTGGLRIQERRYGSFITQIFPLLGSKMHLSLHSLIVLYSASFNLFYLFVVSVLLFRFKNYPLAILMALYYILFASDTYFWTNNEVHQAVAWMFLWIGWVMDYKERKRSFAIHLSAFAVLAFFSIFTHPLILFVLPFLWLFVCLDKDKLPYSRTQFLLTTTLLLLLCFAKYYLIKHNAGYDSEKVNFTKHLSLKDVFLAFKSPLARIMFRKLITDYYLVSLLFISGSVIAFLQKKYTHLALTLFFSTGYFIAVCLTFNDFLTFYTESEWMPFTIITTILFIYYGLPKLKPGLAISLLVLICVIRLGYITAAAPKFTARKAWVYGMLNKMDQQGINKGYILRNDNTERILIMSWGLPTESLLASSLRGDKPTKTFITDSPEGIEKRKVATADMMGSFGPWNNAALNPVYFKIDTTTNYRPIEKQ